MKERIEILLVEVSPAETRIAVVDEKNTLVEFHIDRINQKSLVGGVYQGRVVRVEKGMDAAFLDVGIGENVFMSRPGKVHEGENITVQVSRNAGVEKPPQVRKRIEVAGRYVVYLPNESGIKWPSNLKSGRLREKLETDLVQIVQMKEGWALRPQSARTDIDMIRSEMCHLKGIWEGVDLSKNQTPTCILPPPTILERILRDRTADGPVIVDDRSVLLELQKRISLGELKNLDELHFHDGCEPLFETYGVNDCLDEAQSPVIVLRNGGRITIETTRALTAIDVDLGRSAGKQRSDEAVFAMNNAAAEAIPQQLRLRNIAGLIVVDFIGMRRKDHRRKLVERLKQEFRSAAVPVDVLGMTAAGLIEVTRRRDGFSLDEMMLGSSSAGIQLSSEALASQALRDLLNTRGAGKFRLLVSADLARVLSGDFKLAFDETVRRLGGALTMIEDPYESEYRIEREFGKS